MRQAWEISNFLSVSDGKLHIDGVSAADLAAAHGTPLFVFSERRIRHNIERLQAAGDVIGCGLKICYAAKAISNMAILRAVKDAGSDIEVNSGGELWKALQAGFDGSRINFNGTSKEVWELELAIKSGVFAIQCDSLFELSLIDETARRLNLRANVSLRLVPEIETKTHSGLQTALVTSKFGMMPDEAMAAFRQYKDSPAVNLCGVHLHIGSQNPDSSPYTDAFLMLFRNLEGAYRETGIKLSHINLGGGFPVNYLRDGRLEDKFPAEQKEMFEADFSPADAIGPAWKTVHDYAAASGSEHLLDGLTLAIEPGRSVVADAAICLTTVRNAKSRPRAAGTSEVDNWLLTDAGFNILLSMETYKWYYHLISADRADSETTHEYKVAGPLCDGGDVYIDIEGHGRLPEHRLLPADVQPGELLALLNCGAYSVAQMSEYNGRFLPAIVLIDINGEPRLARKRDTFQDLIRNDVW